MTWRSPNFGPRRNGLRPQLIVLHYTAMTDFEAAAKALCSPEREVSSHYLIGRSGEVAALVDEEMRAWHAGIGSWQGASDVNSQSIGIELDNDGVAPFSEPLMATLESLLPGIMARWNIPPQNVIGHSDFAPGRKQDPGTRFDWKRLARQGLSVWPTDPLPAPQSTDFPKFRDDATAFGFPRVDDALLLDAFRIRFRPWARGPLDAEDCAQMADLARRFPGLDRATDKD